MNIVTVPLRIVDKNNAFIRNAFGQIRAVYQEKQLVLTAACEEGIFEASVSAADLNAIAKQPFPTHHTEKPIKDSATTGGDTWLDTWLQLLGIKPCGESKFALAAKLTTDYDESQMVDGDEGSGDDTDKHEKGPAEMHFKLSINTTGMLAVTYGSLSLVYTDVESVPPASRAQYNLLTWIQDLVAQKGQLQGEANDAMAMLDRQNSVCQALSAEIHQMTSDYKAILQDLEDRYFQVLNQKRRRIAELEPEGPGNLDLLNLEYVKRNSNSLNHVHIEDIVAGKKLVSPVKRSHPKKKRRVGPKTEPTDDIPRFDPEIKPEPRDSGSEARSVHAQTSSQLSDSPSNKNPNGADLGADLNSDSTHYSGPDSDSGNETQYSE